MRELQLPTLLKSMRVESLTMNEGKEIIKRYENGILVGTTETETLEDGSIRSIKNNMIIHNTSYYDNGVLKSSIGKTIDGKILCSLLSEEYEENKYKLIYTETGEVISRSEYNKNGKILSCYGNDFTEIYLRDGDKLIKQINTRTDSKGILSTERRFIYNGALEYIININALTGLAKSFNIKYKDFIIFIVHQNKITITAEFLDENKKPNKSCTFTMKLSDFIKMMISTYKDQRSVGLFDGELKSIFNTRKIYQAPVGETSNYIHDENIITVGFNYFNEDSGLDYSINTDYIRRNNTVILWEHVIPYFYEDLKVLINKLL